VKVVHLATYAATGGAARAAVRLHAALRAHGVDSHVRVRFGAGEWGSEPADPPVLRPFARMLRRLDRLPLDLAGVHPAAPFTPAVVPGVVASRVRALAPDVVHLHWIADGLLSIEALAALPRPIVWTLHDSWAFTGGCHVPQACTRYRERCGRCPQLASSRDDDLSRRIWERKRRHWSGLPLTLVTPSRWLAACASASSLLAGFRMTVIPNGLDLERFRPRDRDACRARLGLPRDRRIVLTGGHHVLGDPNKGLDLLWDAWRRLAGTEAARDVECVVLGAPPGAPLPATGIPARSAGIVTDEDELAAWYAAADVFVAPSRLENLPSMVMEALACGVPCAAFDAGGVPDLIAHRTTGWLAPPYDTAELARGLAWLLEDAPRRREFGANGRRHAEAEYDERRVAQRYADLYAELAPARAR